MKRLARSCSDCATDGDGVRANKQPIAVMNSLSHTNKRRAPVEKDNRMCPAHSRRNCGHSPRHVFFEPTI
jgi:hypothetical protein